MSKKNMENPLFVEKASAVRFLVLDVDGVMTTGKIIYGSGGDDVKEFDAKDGAGMKLWRRAGLSAGIISGRSSVTIPRRAEELGVELVEMEAKDKLPAFERMLRKAGVGPEETAVIGDDLMDLPLIARAGLGIAVADAVSEVKDAAAYITRKKGGRGAVREVIEAVLKAQDRWKDILARYTRTEP